MAGYASFNVKSEGVEMTVRAGRGDDRRLCRILGVHPSRQSIIYAGDDENDAKAMLWLLDRGGTAIAVGDRVRMRGIMRVAGPARLAHAIREMMEAATAAFDTGGIPESSGLPDAIRRLSDTEN